MIIHVNKSDIYSTEMADELVAVSALMRPNNIPSEVLQLTSVVNNDKFVPNVVVTLRIILTVPVLVTSGSPN